VKPVVGDPPRDTPAAVAGLANGETIRAIGEEPVHTWTDVRWLLLKEAVKREAVLLEVEAANGSRSTRKLETAAISKDDLDRDFLGKLGLRPYRPAVPATLGRVLPGSAAERAGLALGDRVVAINGKPMKTWFDFTAEISASPGKDARARGRAPGPPLRAARHAGQRGRRRRAASGASASRPAPS
jgi:regulator of sigma E protease